MLTTKTTPTTKQSLITALQQSTVQSVLVNEPVTKKDVQTLSKNLQSFIGNGQKSVSVVFLKDR